MSASRPQLEDCVHRFRLYGRNLGTLCEEPDDDRHALRPQWRHAPQLGGAADACPSAGI